MPKIKHIAISSTNPDETAKFYKECFDMEEVGKLDGKNAYGYYLSDGNINMAILNFKNDVVAGEEFGKEYSGIHHIGFQVEDIADTEEKLRKNNSAPRDSINQALGVGMDNRHANVEKKYSGPNGEIIDISQTGWVGTSGID
ncbi:MAG TPA: bleomycin resistance protein [Dehalococcoidia bacterium]|jgi:glyoxylase I family protein|nr:bleomycin resistance protein [Dehalococcoidia bacterium]